MTQMSQARKISNHKLEITNLKMNATVMHVMMNTMFTQGLERWLTGQEDLFFQRTGDLFLAPTLDSSWLLITPVSGNPTPAATGNTINHVALTHTQDTHIHNWNNKNELLLYIFFLKMTITFENRRYRRH